MGPELDHIFIPSFRSLLGPRFGRVSHRRIFLLSAEVLQADLRRTSMSVSVNTCFFSLCVPLCFLYSRGPFLAAMFLLVFSRERLRRVLRKKQPLYYIFTPSHLLIYIFTPADLDHHTLTPADLDLHTLTSADLDLHTFTPADLDLHTSHLQIYIITRSHLQI